MIKFSHHKSKTKLKMWNYFLPCPIEYITGFLCRHNVHEMRSVSKLWKTMIDNAAKENYLDYRRRCDYDFKNLCDFIPYDVYQNLFSLTPFGKFYCSILNSRSEYIPRLGVDYALTSCILVMKNTDFKWIDSAIEIFKIFPDIISLTENFATLTYNYQFFELNSSKIKFKYDFSAFIFINSDDVKCIQFLEYIKRCLPEKLDGLINIAIEKNNLSAFKWLVQNNAINQIYGPKFENGQEEFFDYYITNVHNNMLIEDTCKTLIALNDLNFVRHAEHLINLNDITVNLYSVFSKKCEVLDYLFDKYPAIITDELQHCMANRGNIYGLKKTIQHLGHINNDALLDISSHGHTKYINHIPNATALGDDFFYNIVDMIKKQFRKENRYKHYHSITDIISNIKLKNMIDYASGLGYEFSREDIEALLSDGNIGDSVLENMIYGLKSTLLNRSINLDAKKNKRRNGKLKMRTGVGIRKLCKLKNRRDKS